MCLFSVFGDLIALLHLLLAAIRNQLFQVGMTARMQCRLMASPERVLDFCVRSFAAVLSETCSELLCEQFSKKTPLSYENVV